MKIFINIGEGLCEEPSAKSDEKRNWYMCCFFLSIVMLQIFSLFQATCLSYQNLLT